MPTSADAGRTSAPTKQPAARVDTTNSGAILPATDSSPEPSASEIRWLAVICILAAARVFFGAAALPFFADTDENAHFDLVHKFARGYWPNKKLDLRDPRTLELRDRQTIDLTIFDHSPEFQAEPDEYRQASVPARYRVARIPPPVRVWPEDGERDAYLTALGSILSSQPNHEAHEPPLYYALAGAWYDLGGLFHLSRPATVYWVRFLNVPLYAALVVTAFFFARPYFGRDVALAAAALIAFFPNTVFFTINNDVLSPLATALALFLLMRWYGQDTPGARLAIAAGVTAAAAVLVKLPNIAILVVLAAVVLLRARRVKGKVLREAWPLLLSAALPLLLFGLRNRNVLGDWTGGEAKALLQNWTPKPLSQLTHHPLFTGKGLYGFLSTLCVSFFNGDASWHRHPVLFGPAVKFFLISAPLLPIVGIVAAFRGGATRTRSAASISAIVIVAYVCVLAVLSLLWDFGSTRFPSQDFPFFAFGRLAAGALVPFLTLYALGMQTLVGRRSPLFLAAIVATVALMLLAQMPYLKLAIASEYNWFHLHD